MSPGWQIGAVHVIWGESFREHPLLDVMIFFPLPEWCLWFKTLGQVAGLSLSVEALKEENCRTKTSKEMWRESESERGLDDFTISWVNHEIFAFAVMPVSGFKSACKFSLLSNRWLYILVRLLVLKPLNPCISSTSKCLYFLSLYVKSFILYWEWCAGIPSIPQHPGKECWMMMYVKEALDSEPSGIFACPGKILSFPRQDTRIRIRRRHKIRESL